MVYQFLHTINKTANQDFLVNHKYPSNSPQDLSLSALRASPPLYVDPQLPTSHPHTVGCHGVGSVCLGPVYMVPAGWTFDLFEPSDLAFHAWLA